MEWWRKTDRVMEVYLFIFVYLFGSPLAMRRYSPGVHTLKLTYIHVFQNQILIIRVNIYQHISKKKEKNKNKGTLNITVYTHTHTCKWNKNKYVKTKPKMNNKNNRRHTLNITINTSGKHKANVIHSGLNVWFCRVVPNLLFKNWFLC